MIGQLVLLPLYGTSTSLQFHGNHSFSDSLLAERLSHKGLNTEVVSAWTSDERRRARRIVQIYYRDRGYPLCSVQFEPSSHGFTLKVSEGPKARLSQVCFEGNKYLSDDHLATFFKLGDWFSQGDVAGSLEGIRKYYENEGFIRAKTEVGPLRVSRRRSISYFPVPFRFKNASCASLKCIISEGPKYHFGEIAFPDGFDLGDLTLPEPGGVFRQDLLARMKAKIIRRFQQEGQLLKKLTLLQEVREDLHCVDVMVDVETYPTLLINRIEFTGNERFPDSFYRRELVIYEKGIFHPADLEQSLLRLSRTGTLEPLAAEDIELTVDEEALEIDVLLRLKERNRQGVLYSFGPGQLGGLEASLVYSILNLVGLGEALGLGVSIGDSSTGVAVQFASHYLLGTDLPVSVVLGLFRQHTGISLPGVDEEILDLLGMKEKGVTGQLNYRLSSKQSVALGLSLAQRDSGTRHLLFSPSLSSGNHWKISQRVSLLKGVENSWNLRPSIDWTQKAWEKLEFRISGSHSFFFGNQEPFSERLFIRPGYVRGFSFAGPLGIRDETPAPVGGDTLISFNSAYAVPVAKPVSLVPFLDMGWISNLTRLDEYKILENTDKLPRCSTGSELRVKVPRLPEVRLIFSWNILRLKPEPSLAQFREPAFNFRIGFDRW